MKILILGHMRSGKDCMAEIFNKEFGLEYTTSSMIASELFIYKALKDKYGYNNPLECFEDRVNHRSEWYDMICEYNKEDKAKLAKYMMSVSDCYVGMRDADEIMECKRIGLFDIIIWVDASERVPNEGSDSFNIDKNVADIIIENNSSYSEYVDKVKRLGNVIFN